MADDKESGRYRVRIFLEDIAGNLASDELVVGHVGIQGIDDPIAISPGIGPRSVVAEPTKTIAVAGDVEPMARPALTVMLEG